MLKTNKSEGTRKEGTDIYDNGKGRLILLLKSRVPMIANDMMDTWRMRVQN
jgi:hypothetical protein